MSRVFKCDDPNHWMPVTSTIVRCVHCGKLVKRKSSAMHKCQAAKRFEETAVGRIQIDEAQHSV